MQEQAEASQWFVLQITYLTMDNTQAGLQKTELQLRVGRMTKQTNELASNATMNNNNDGTGIIWIQMLAVENE